MIQRLSAIRIVSNFLTETSTEFMSRHGIDPVVDFSGITQTYPEEVSDFVEAYLDIIPRTYRDVFPTKRETLDLIQDLYPGNERADTAALLNLVATINEAIKKDRADWNRTPDLPKIRTKLPDKKQVQEPSFRKEVNTLTKKLVGASHKNIKKVLDSIFGVTDEESDAYWEGSESFPEEKQKSILLAWSYRANLETASKEGDTEEVSRLLTQYFRNKSKSVEELQNLWENIHEPTPAWERGEPDSDADLQDYLNQRTEIPGRDTP